MWVRRWWRSSAWRARCGPRDLDGLCEAPGRAGPRAAAPAPAVVAPGAGRVTCRRGGPGGSRRPPSTPTCPGRRWRTSTPSSPRSRTAPRPPRSTGWSTRRSPGSTPARAAAEAARAADGRHVTIEEEQVSFAGTMTVTAELDLADALDLAAAVTHGAEQLKALGSDETLDARRAAAVGEMARAQLALPLVAEGAHQPAGRPARPPDRGRPGRPARARHPRHPRPGPALVHPVPHPGDREAGPRPQRAHHLRRLPTLTPAPRPGHSPRPALRFPVVHPTGKVLRPRPHRPLGAGRRDHDSQPRRPLPATSPPQDPHRLDLRRAGPATYEWTSPHGHRFITDPTGTDPG